LQWLLKNALAPLPSTYQAPFCGVLPEICKVNMAWRLAKCKAKKFGIGSTEDVPAAIPPTWIHRSDPRYTTKQLNLVRDTHDAAAPCSASSTVNSPLDHQAPGPS
jgi:hypothetical protein